MAHVASPETVPAHRWPGDGPIVVCIHNITGSQRAWIRLHAELAGEFQLVTFDLRGRASRFDVAGPYGLDVNAADARTALNGLGIDRVDVVVGHSIGAFTALRLPDLGLDVRAFVLVDGGVDVTAGRPAGEVFDALLEPAQQRLRHRSPSYSLHVAWYTGQIGLPRDDVAQRMFVDGASRRFDDGWGQATQRAALEADLHDSLFDSEITDRLARLTGPVDFIAASEGPSAGTPPFYPSSPSGVSIDRWTRVPGTTHYTIVLGQSGVGAIAASVRRASGSQL